MSLLDKSHKFTMGSRCTSLPHLQEYKVLEDGLIDALRQMAVHDLALASLFIEGYLKNDLHPDDRRALERIKTDPIPPIREEEK